MRGFQTEGKNLNEAIKLAISTCIKENILAEFLKKHQTEVINMLNWDVDKSLHAKYEEGREKGIKQGIEQGQEKRELEIAKSMLIDEMPMPIISKHTGFSLSELDIISTEIKDSMKD